MQNDLKVGQEYCASIDTGRPWIRYSKGNDGELDYYRDYCDEYGSLMYCDGEVFELVGIEPGAVWLKEVGECAFKIPLKQFEADFVRAVGFEN